MSSVANADPALGHGAAMGALDGVFAGVVDAYRAVGEDAVAVFDLFH